MPKFAVGNWVRPKGQKHRGRVCDNCGQGVLVRWAGTQKADRWSSRSLVKCNPPSALILEGSLDDALESIRSEEGLLRTWLTASNVPVAYKNILTLQDLSIISRAMGDNRPVFVHISCHGDYEGKKPYIVFAPRARKQDRIYLDDPTTVETFRESFAGLPILFSACLLGKYETPMETFRKDSNLSAIAAFSRVVYDSEAMLFELLLYQAMLVNGWTFRKAVDTASIALLKMGVRGGRGHSQRFVRVF